MCKIVQIDLCQPATTLKMLFTNEYISNNNTIIYNNGTLTSGSLLSNEYLMFDSLAAFFCNPLDRYFESRNFTSNKIFLHCHIIIFIFK